MRAVDTIRYVVAWLLLISGPGAVLFWFPIHPFARFWRRVGPRWAYAVGLSVYAACALGAALLGPLLLSIDFGTHAVPLVLGVCLVAGHRYMRARWRQHLTLRTLFGVPELAPGGRVQVLLTEGVYGRVRHPRYLETILGFAGYACLSNYLAAYGVALFVLVGILILIPMEERELVERFGAHYEEYQRQVPALIPRKSRSVIRIS